MSLISSTVFIPPPTVRGMKTSSAVFFITSMIVFLFSTEAAISKKQIIVGGGLSSYNDLNNLLNIGKPLLEGVIVGKSFYTGNINIKKAQNIFKNA